MRHLIAAAVITLLAIPAHADTMKNCGAAWTAKTPEAVAAKTYAAWSKICLAKGYTTPKMGMEIGPVVPAGATGQCKDGTFTMSKTHSGACSSHGGVTKWL